MKLMRALGVFLTILFLTFSSVSAQDSAPRVLVLKANEDVAPAMRDYIARGIRTAEQQQAELLVIELNTPGGFIVTMTDIVSNIRASRVPVIVYVSPRGGMAASAGALITLAGHAAAMAPETIIGAASPVSGTGQDLTTTMRAKENEALKAMVRTSAGRRAPEAIKLAEASIESAKAVSAEEAKKAGLVDFIASDLNDLLKQLDGFEVQMESGPRTLHTANATVSDLPIDFGEQILDILVRTDTVFLLMALGLMAILIELSAPGGWVAGFIGVVALILSVYGLGILTVNWFGAIFLALAFVLFILDIKTTAHGALTAAGIGSFIVGALVLFNSPDVPEFQRVSVPLVIVVALIIGASFAIILGFALKAQKTPLRMGQETLIGAVGTARGQINPRGQVQLKSELWSAELAEGAESIESGEKVVVVAIEGLRLKVG
ncbi:MAG: nodulation protein NfeD [Chloroflexi bacterium]|nr:nodulation protein NfeD [Chloroflexota bacterium]